MTVRALLLVMLAFACGSCGGRSLPDPGVRLGGDAYERAPLATLHGVGEVTDLRVSGTSILVAGGQGAVTIMADGTLSGFVPFSPTGGRVEMVDVEGDGTWEYLNRGGGWQPVWLAGSDGILRWRYGHAPDVAPDDVAAGDLDGDGRLDFVVGCNGGGGIHRLDADGRLVWKMEASNVWQVEIARDGARGPVIWHSDAGGTCLTERSPDGTPIPPERAFPGIDHFRLLTGLDGESWVVYPTRSGITASRLDGSRTLLLHRAGTLHPYTFTASFVDFAGSITPKLVVLVGGKIPYQYQDYRTDLEVFELDGTSCYHEVLDGWWRSVKADGDRLLIGGPDRVDVLRARPGSTGKDAPDR